MKTRWKSFVVASLASLLLAACELSGSMPEDIRVRRENDPETGSWDLVIGQRSRSIGFPNVEPELLEDQNTEDVGEVGKPSGGSIGECEDEGPVTWQQGNYTHEFSGKADSCLLFSINVMPNHQYDVIHVANASVKLWNPGGHLVDTGDVVRHGGDHTLAITPIDSSKEYIVVVKFVPGPNMEER